MSQSRFKVHKSCISLFAVNVRGVKKPKGSKIRASSERIVRLEQSLFKGLT